MKKRLVFCVILLFIFPIISASLESSMNEVDSYVSEYKEGKITAPQLIVYIEYIKSKMYEELSKEGKRAFNEEEIKAIFDKTDIQNFAQYEKKFLTDDFHLIFRADSFFRHDRGFYEQREEDLQNYYLINYELVAIDTETSELSRSIESFISDLQNMVENEANEEKEEQIRKNFNKIRQRIWNFKDQEACEKLMKEVGMTEREEDFGKDNSFFYKIKEETEQNCWINPKCEWTCDKKEVCEDCKPICEDKEICGEDICDEITICEEEGEEQVCTTTKENCIPDCNTEKECTHCEENCWTEDDCYDVCEDKEECDEFISGEIILEGHCMDEKADIYVNAWGENFDRYQRLNDGGEWNCESEIKNFVKLRKVLQKDINNEFARWYFEDFLNGDDYDKIINGEAGFENVLRLLIRNEENIANNIHCSETKEWPQGFEKIDISYINENTHVEVWEKNIPVEWENTKYYTTLYKYSWIPSHELLKGLIEYQLSETQTIGPTAEDVTRIRANEGQMELVNSLSKNYGGSFDVKLELNEKENDFVVRKYLQINPDVIIRFVDSIEDKEDISIEVDYDSLYNFIRFVTKETKAEEIEGPHWVYIEGGKGGPGTFFSVVGAASKMWKEGITIKPRYTLLKLIFNSKNILGLMGSSNVESSEYRGETTKISGKLIQQR